MKQKQIKTNNQKRCNGGQTISDNVGSSRNPLQGKVLATSESNAYGLQATLEQSNYKITSNMETTGNVRLKSPKVVSLLSDGTPRSSKVSDIHFIKTCIECNRENIGGDKWYDKDHEVVIAYKCAYSHFAFVDGYCNDCRQQQKFNEGLEGMRWQQD